MLSLGDRVDPVERVERVVETEAMASRILMRVVSEVGTDIDRQLRDAIDVFHAVDRTCTRFDDASDLMRANASPGAWVAVDRLCFDALVEAHAAYRRTGGRFDPRVLSDLVRLGYDRSLRFGPPSARTGTALEPRPPLQPWHPEFRRADTQVRIGSVPVDLGGIGKGLALRWAADTLRGIDSFLLDAGGDCVCRGTPAEGGDWQVGVEDPRGSSDPLVTLAVRDAAIATSSVRIRQWRIDGQDVHHLIDPMTGQPGGQGLLAVTVVDTDPATAEVWSKTLFLAGRHGVRPSAEHHGVAALWVDADGNVEWTAGIDGKVTWMAAA